LDKTIRLYWERPYDTGFSATVTDVWQDDGRLFLVLDATLFYPEGGGQPCDYGVIVPDVLLREDCLQRIPGCCHDAGSEYQVSNVFEQDGRIIHVLANCSHGFGKGQTVHGEIDWERRFDFMQQHTGQHILSRAFEEICGAGTVGFHLGKDYVSIDLDVSSIDDSCLAAVEDLANQIVFRNLPVQVKEFEQHQVPDKIRRRIPTESGAVRIIYAGDFDACACGGTHVHSTGEVGIIKVNQLDRSHGGVRVIFRCGKRALLDLREKERILGDTARALSVGYQDLSQAVVLLSQKVADLDKETGRLKKELMEYEIESIAREIQSVDIDECIMGSDGHRVLYTQEGEEGQPGQKRGFAVRHCGGKQPAELRYMAKAIGDLTGKMVVLFSVDPQFSLVAASPANDNKDSGDAPGCKSKEARLKKGFDVSPDKNASLVVSRLAQKWGLRGGGTPGLAQMGSKEPLGMDEEEILRDIADVVCVLET
jgi:alanyl-tRNA synthetase